MYKIDKYLDVFNVKNEHNRDSFIFLWLAKKCQNFKSQKHDKTYPKLVWFKQIQQTKTYIVWFYFANYYCILLYLLIK